MIPHDMTSLNECLTGLMSCVLGHACAPERSWHHPEVFWVYSHLAVWSLWALCCVRACCTLSWSNPSLSVAPSHLIRHCLERLRNTEREFIYLRSFRHTKHVLSKLCEQIRSALFIVNISKFTNFIPAAAFST